MKPSSTALLAIEDSISSDSSLRKSLSIPRQPHHSADSTLSAAESANHLISLSCETASPQINLELMDTSGKLIQPSAYSPFSHSFVLFFNLCEVWTFDALQSWIEKIQSASGPKFTPTFSALIGTHSDLSQAKCFDRLESKLLADFLQCPYFEISTKTGSQLKPTLNKLVQTLILSNAPAHREKRLTQPPELGSLNLVDLETTPSNSHQPFLDQSPPSSKHSSSDPLSTWRNLDSLFEGFALINGKKHYLRLCEQQLLILKPQTKHHLKAALNALCPSHSDNSHMDYHLVDMIDLKSTKVTRKRQKVPVLTFVKHDETTYHIKFNDESIVKQWLSKLSNTPCASLVYTHNQNHAIQFWEELLKKNDASTLQLFHGCPSLSKYLSPSQLHSIENALHLNKLRVDWSVSSNHRLKKLYSIPENQFCADCGAQYPLHASTRLGILICTPCNRIHKELGTKASKTRPIAGELPWDSIQVALVQVLGNKFFNQIFEAKILCQNSEESARRTLDQKLSLLPEWTQKNLVHSEPRPDASSCMSSAHYLAQNRRRKQFIQAKHVSREFMKEDQKQISKKLHLDEEDRRKLGLLASQPQKIQQIAHIILCGVPPDTVCDDEGKTMLHVAAENENSLTMLLLLENGANWFRRDIQGLDALDHVLKTEEKTARWDAILTDKNKIDEKWDQKNLEKKLDTNLLSTECGTDSQKSSLIVPDVSCHARSSSDGPYKPQVYVSPRFSQKLEQVTRQAGDTPNSFAHSIFPIKATRDQRASNSFLTSHSPHFDSDQSQSYYAFPPSRESPRDDPDVLSTLSAPPAPSPERLESLQYPQRADWQDTTYRSVGTNRRRLGSDRHLLDSTPEATDQQDQYYEESVSASIYEEGVPASPASESAPDGRQGCVSEALHDGWEERRDQSSDYEVLGLGLHQDDSYSYEDIAVQSASHAAHLSVGRLPVVRRTRGLDGDAPSLDNGSESALQTEIWPNFEPNLHGTLPAGQRPETASSKQYKVNSSCSLLDTNHSPKPAQNPGEPSLQRSNVPPKRDGRHAEPAAGDQPKSTSDPFLLSYSLDYHEQVEESADVAEGDSRPRSRSNFDQNLLSRKNSLVQRPPHSCIKIPNRPVVHYSEGYLASPRHHQNEYNATKNHSSRSHWSQFCAEDTKTPLHYFPTEGSSRHDVQDPPIAEHPKPVDATYSPNSDLTQHSTSFQYVNHSTLEYAETIDSKSCYLPTSNRHVDHSTLEYAETIDSKSCYLPTSNRHVDHSTLEYTETINSRSSYLPTSNRPVDHSTLEYAETINSKSSYLPTSSRHIDHPTLEYAETADPKFSSYLLKFNSAQPPTPHRANQPTAGYADTADMSPLCANQMPSHRRSPEHQVKDPIEALAPHVHLSQSETASWQVCHPLNITHHSPPQTPEQPYGEFAQFPSHFQTKQPSHPIHSNTTCHQLTPNDRSQPHHPRQTCKSPECLGSSSSSSPHPANWTSQLHHQPSNLDHSTPSSPQMPSDSLYLVPATPTHRHTPPPLNRASDASNNLDAYTHTHDSLSPAKPTLIQSHARSHHHDSSLFQRQPLSSKNCQHLIPTNDPDASLLWASPHRHPHSNNMSPRVRKLPCAYPQTSQTDTQKSPIRVLKKNQAIILSPTSPQPHSPTPTR